MALLDSLSYFMPLFAFLLVFIVTFALLAKTKILGGNSFLHFFVSFLLSIVFVVAPSAQKFIVLSTPWFVVLIIMIFIILLLITFVRGKMEDLVQSPVVAVVIIGLVLIIFIAAAINVFGPLISSYLPGASETGVSSQSLQAKHFFESPAVIGAIILLIVAAITSWILTKS
jgi:hypothetical protein